MNERDQTPAVGELALLLKRAGWQAGLLAAFVFVSLVVLLPSLAKYHGDECFYTDAAIRMIQTGDYATPYAASGALRFAKPILPYWGVLAGYFVFGINFFGSRVVFLLAGCTIIYFTYRLSLALFARPTEAVLAALIMASNVQLLTISIRSTPDALLCLFVLLSLLGFARLIFNNDRSWSSYALAYLGGALAVETRGLPGLGVLVFPLLFTMLFRRGQTPLRQLFEWKAVLLGLIVGGSWFGLMLWLHGRALIDGFYYDQVTENVRDFHSLDTVRNLSAYLGGVLRHFLPWSAFLLLGLMLDREAILGFWREHRSKCWFLLGWFLFILAPFIFGGYYRTRYMIVTYPLLAVLTAALLSQCAPHLRFRAWTLRMVSGCALVLVLLGLALTGAGVVIHHRILAGGIIFALGGVGIWFLVRRATPMAAWIAVAAVGLVPFWVTEVCLRPVFSKSPAPALTAKLLPDESTRRRVYALNVSPSFQAQLRVLSAGRLSVVPMSTESLNDLSTGVNPLVFADTEKPIVASRPGLIEQAGFASRHWKGRDFADLLPAAKREEAFARNLVPYYILSPEAPKR